MYWQNQFLVNPLRAMWYYASFKLPPYVISGQITDRNLTYDAEAFFFSGRKSALKITLDPHADWPKQTFLFFAEGKKHDLVLPDRSYLSVPAIEFVKSADRRLLTPFARERLEEILHIP